MNECILVVDDDREIVKAIAILLEKEDYRVLRAYDGMEALDILAGNQVQLLIIDVMMPRLDGLSAVMRIREKRNLPIIVLSAKSEDSDKILGLSMGADDYVTKPYNPQELAARVKSQLRRYTRLGDIHASEQTEELTNGRLTFRTDERILYADGEAVKLTATETKIMELFMRNLGRVFPAEEIYRRVWDEEAYAPENTVMVHIRRIREKIELNPKQPEYLKGVWGIGYKMETSKDGYRLYSLFSGAHPFSGKSSAHYCHDCRRYNNRGYEGCISAGLSEYLRLPVLYGRLSGGFPFHGFRRESGFFLE